MDYLKLAKSASYISKLFLKDDFDDIEYGDLFYGTNANIYIPLWASCCINDWGLLFDATTLDVISIYKRNGYIKKEMDGNPPDFIAQMYRFVSYMAASLVGKFDERIENELISFLDKYLIPTSKHIRDDIYKYAKEKSNILIADSLNNFILGEYIYDDEIEFKYNILNGLNPPIEIEEGRIIKCANRNNCGNRCSAEAFVKEGCILSIDTNSYFKPSGMRLCAKGLNYINTYMTGKRLRYPMKRIGIRGEGRFKRISWDEAINDIYTNWVRIRENYGVGSRYIQYGSGDMGGVACGKNWIKRLLNLEGGFLDYYGTYSSHCASYITPYIYGDNFSASSSEDIYNSKLLILWGHNPIETGFGSQSARIILDAKKNGLKVIVIDPRLSDSMKSLGDEWIAPLPSTDGALADAICYVIFKNNLQDQMYIDKYTVGFDRHTMPEGVDSKLCYKDYLFGTLDGIEKSPEWAEKICKVKASVIEKLAIEIATTKPMKLWAGLGYQRTGNGEQAVRSVCAIPALTGNVGIIGGGAGGAGFVTEEKRPVVDIGKNNYGAKISCFLWVDAIDHGKEMTKEHDHIQGVDRLKADIKMMFNCAGNTTINQHSDINNTIPYLVDESKCEYMLCTDVFMTPSARFMDIILPAPSFFELDDFVRPWRSGHFAIYNNRCINPIFGVKLEYDWVSVLAKKLGLYDEWSNGHNSYLEWVEDIYNKLYMNKQGLPDFDTFKMQGGHIYTEPKTYIAYKKQIDDIENNPFKTPSGKIEIFSKTIYDMGSWSGIPAIPGYVPSYEGIEDSLREKYPLQLISYHTKRRTHSIQDVTMKMEHIDPQSLWINPVDAEKRDIKNGDTVLVFNDRGIIKLKALVTERIISGVIATQQGAWFTPNKDGIDERGSINVLTSTKPSPFSKGNPQQTNLVEVKKEN